MGEILGEIFSGWKGGEIFLFGGFWAGFIVVLWVFCRVLEGLEWCYRILEWFGLSWVLFCWVVLFFKGTYRLPGGSDWLVGWLVGWWVLKKYLLRFEAKAPGSAKNSRKCVV